jgi:hypothetical protein
MYISPARHMLNMSHQEDETPAEHAGSISYMQPKLFYINFNREEGSEKNSIDCCARVHVQRFCRLQE